MSSSKISFKNRFNFVVGNPPYQSLHREQIYGEFYVLSTRIGETVCLIFPSSWQDVKTGKGLTMLNNVNVKRDRQIVFIDNVIDVFKGVKGAMFTNVILWKNGHDNGLDGKQRILENGEFVREDYLDINFQDVDKPAELLELRDCVSKKKFLSFQRNIIKNPYSIESNEYVDLEDEEKGDKDVKVHCKMGHFFYKYSSQILHSDSKRLPKYRLFIPSQWGSMDAKYLGGQFARVIIGMPNECCSNTFLEAFISDSHEEVVKCAKYCMTRFFRGLLFLNKFSKSSYSSFIDIPIQNFKEDFWSGTVEELDEALMAKYEVPESVKEFVFKNVQKKDEQDIVNIMV